MGSTGPNTPADARPTFYSFETSAAIIKARLAVDFLDLCVPSSDNVQ